MTNDKGNAWLAEETPEREIREMEQKMESLRTMAQEIGRMVSGTEIPVTHASIRISADGSVLADARFRATRMFSTRNLRRPY